MSFILINTVFIFKFELEFHLRFAMVDTKFFLFALHRSQPQGGDIERMPWKSIFILRNNQGIK